MVEKLSQEEPMSFHFAIFTAVRRQAGDKCTEPFNKHTDIIIVIITFFSCSNLPHHGRLRLVKEDQERNAVPNIALS